MLTSEIDQTTSAIIRHELSHINTYDNIITKLFTRKIIQRIGKDNYCENKPKKIPYMHEKEFRADLNSASNSIEHAMQSKKLLLITMPRFQEFLKEDFTQRDTHPSDAARLERVNTFITYLEAEEKIKNEAAFNSLFKGKLTFKDKQEVQAALCNVCKKKETEENKLKKCSYCRKVQYCSIQCQKAHWREHKLVCLQKTASITQESPSLKKGFLL